MATGMKSKINSRRERVYVAGAYNGGDIISSLENMRRAMRMGFLLFKEGFCPYVPHHDYHMVLQADYSYEFSFTEFYQFSMKMLEGFESVYVLPYSEDSVGTQLEIAHARELDIPVFYDLESLKRWSDSNNVSYSRS